MMDSKLLVAKAANEAQLRSLENVVGVGVGFKVTRGQVTDQPAIIVYVRRKVASASLAAAQTVPTTLGDIPTDVIEAGDVTILVTDTATHRARHRPMMGGTSCGSRVAVAGAGTLGLPLVYRNGVPGLLSNKHVISPNWTTTRDPGFVWKGSRTRQPAWLDGGTGEDEIAEVQDLVPILLGQDNEVDADYASYLPGQQREAQLLGLGGYTALGDAEPGMEVAKSGRTSGVTTGRRILSVATRIIVAYPGMGEVSFVDQVVTEPMLSPGDSGSVIMSGETVVALGFAGSATLSIATPIKKVFEKLGLSLQGPAPPINQPVPIDQGLQSLLSQGVLRVAWGFDANTQKFLLFDPAAPALSDLALLEPGKGYWLSLVRDAVLSFGGHQTPVYNGWNLVGWRN
jgi:hypothetical protein